MTKFTSQNPDFITIIQRSFACQGLMAHLGAELTDIQLGQVTIKLPFAPTLTQQHRFFHAGGVTSIVDSACGYAALSLAPAGSEVLTIEYKVNFVSPAEGDYLIARAEVVKPGRSITVCRGDVFAVSAGEEKLCATMLTTMKVLKAK